VAAGFGVSTATCWRLVNETVELLADRAPKLRAALRAAKQSGMAYVVCDGTLIPIDRVAADRPFYSGKHRMHGMNPQVIASPDGTILWNILAALSEAGMVALGDKGCHGSGGEVITPYRGRGEPASQKTANRAHARLCGLGERANAQLKTWCVP
jgi:hypothetical protein